MTSRHLAPVAVLLLTACPKDPDDSGDTIDDTALVDADGDGVPADEDCDDNDPSIGPPESWYADADGDGFGDPASEQLACSGEPGLVDNAFDCDDGDASMPLLVDQASGSVGGTGSATDPIADIAGALVLGPGCIVVGPGSYAGGLLIEADLILGSLQGPELTTIDAGGAGAVIEVRGGSLSLGGFTLTGGTGSAGKGDGDLLGGGVLARESTGLHVEDCVVTGNQADFGGGLFGPEKGDTTLVDTVLSDNAAVTSGGGFFAVGAGLDGCEINGNQATYGGGGIVYGGEGSAVDTLFSGNTGTQGGGLYVANGGVFAGGSYQDNTAEKGGGVYLDEKSAASGIDASGNSAERGGGVYMETGTSLSEAAISSNEATSYGGGIQADGDIGLSAVSIEGNSAGSLGGGALLASGTVEIEDLSATGNSAVGSGGGLYLHEAQLQGPGLMLSGNQAEYGGGAALASGTIDGRDGTAAISDNVSTTYGGGAYTEGGCVLYGVAFSGNESEHGGGAFVTGTAVLEEVELSANVATGMGGGVLANGSFGLTDGALLGNLASQGAGIFVAAGQLASISGGQVAENQADENGGGARVEGTLSSDAVDWASGGSDNAPDDVYAHGEAYGFDGVSSFTCTGTAGCS